MKVLILGDIMLDEYISITPVKLSQEAPVAVGRYKHTICTLGGAGNAAANVAALGGQAYLAGYIGHDSETIKALMSHHLIEDCTIQAPGWDTIRKVRVVDEAGHQFVRIDYENPEPFIHTDSVAQIKNYILSASLCASTPNLLLSDYGKGTLTGLTELAISAFTKMGKFVVVNGKPQNIARYRDASVVTMNKAEWEQAYRLRDTQPVRPEQVLKAMSSVLPNSTLIMTCGSESVVVYKNDNVLWYPVTPVAIADVSGAGDTFAAVIAVLGNDKPDTIAKAIYSAGEVVGYKGTAVPKWRVI
jgi:D-beta-D-heptose 7-phosphate kinase/D-beta-D-heptose 1-phosphate adenosyltransferase